MGFLLLRGRKEASKEGRKETSARPISLSGVAVLPDPAAAAPAAATPPLRAAPLRAEEPSLLPDEWSRFLPRWNTAPLGGPRKCQSCWGRAAARSRATRASAAARLCRERDFLRGLTPVYTAAARARACTHAPTYRAEIQRLTGAVLLLLFPIVGD